MIRHLSGLSNSGAVQEPEYCLARFPFFLYEALSVPRSAIEEVLSDAPRRGSPGTLTAEQVTQIIRRDARRMVMKIRFQSLPETSDRQSRPESETPLDLSPLCSASTDSDGVAAPHL